VRALAHLHGGRDAIEEAIALLAGTLAEAPARRLLALFDAAASRGSRRGSLPIRARSDRLHITRA